jgi:hypothetical protein
VAAVIAARSRILGWARTPVGLGVAAVGLLLTAGTGGYLLWAGESGGSAPDAPPDYRAELFHVTDCPRDPTADRFVGVDNLFALMGRGGLKLYESTTESLVSGPDGLIATNDVVVIKINYQWDQRGGTNTDLLRGLIRRILDHPDVFSGEIVVCENAQFNPIQNFDRPQNNAQDHSLSPHDVVVAFQGAGHNVSHYDWTSIRYNLVTEYSDGNMADGYIRYPYDSSIQGRVSYPKFRTDAGTYVSLKYGIWDFFTGTYNRDRLVFVNVPVLKSHHATYGATAAVKHYMGVVTDELNTNSHDAIRYGILGALLGEIQLADLNVLDAIWINANPYDGPWTSYAAATRRDELVASVDPVALDIWAVKNILIPAFLANGYTPPWPYPSADPDLPSSAFRQYLDNSMTKIQLAGYQVTNSYDEIDVTAGIGGAGDFDGDSDVDASDFTQFAACFTGPGGGPIGPGCTAGDFDGDDDVDCDDWESFRYVWTDPGDPSALEQCGATDVEHPASSPPSLATSLTRAFPNPMSPRTRIEFAIGMPGRVSLRIVDVTGHVVRTLVDDTLGVGRYDAVWDGRTDSGERVASGVFFCQLRAPSFNGVKKIVLVD